MHLFPEMPNTIDLALSNRKKFSGYKRSVIANFCYVSDKITKDYRFTLKKKLLAKTSHVGPTKVHQT